MSSVLGHQRPPLQGASGTTSTRQKMPIAGDFIRRSNARFYVQREVISPESTGLTEDEIRARRTTPSLAARCSLLSSKLLPPLTSDGRPAPRSGTRVQVSIRPRSAGGWSGRNGAQGRVDAGGKRPLAETGSGRHDDARALPYVYGAARPNKKTGAGQNADACWTLNLPWPGLFRRLCLSEPERPSRRERYPHDGGCR